jgi:very-short-patch-repair endonuclease
MYHEMVQAGGVMNAEWWERIEAAADRDDMRHGGRGWRTVGDAISGIWRSTSGETESAIEAMMGDELKPRAEKWGYEVIPQYELGPFRYDFAIKSKRTEKVIALVECDGRLWHSTDEQRKNDANKDALAKERGLMMFRYAGTELCRDAARCAEEVMFRIYPL